MASVEDQAWVTLSTNDSYALGALVLGQSLRRVGTTRKLVVLITHAVTESMRTILGQVFDSVQVVNVLDSNDTANLALLTRPDLGITFTKLHCWRLTQYTKCVFLDADTLIIQNCDDLFDREELSAAPDVGWPDCFNSGVFVYRPSDETYQSLLQCAVTTGSFDGGDQGLLNMFFSDWATKDIARHLPFIYNMTSSVAYSYLPAYQTFGKDVKIVHFIGPVKPWIHRFNATTGRVEPTPGAYHAIEHLQFWWDVFLQDVKPRLQPELKEEERHYCQPNPSKPSVSAPASIAAGLAGQLALITLGQEMSPEQKALDDRARQFSWEQGQADYLGADAFANIQKKLDEALVAESGSSAPLAADAQQESGGEAPLAPVEAASKAEPEAPITPVILAEVSMLSQSISQEIVSQVSASVPETVSVSEELPQPVLPSPPVDVEPATKAAPAPQTPTETPPALESPTKVAPASPLTTASPIAVTTVAIPPKPLEAGPIPPEPISPPPALPPPPKSRATPSTPPAASGPPPLASPTAASPLPVSSKPQEAAAATPAVKPSKSSGGTAPPKQKGTKKPKSP